MPITIKANQFIFKDPRTDEYIPVDKITTDEVETVKQTASRYAEKIKEDIIKQKLDTTNLIASAWSKNVTYNIGDYVTRVTMLKNVYRCIADQSTQGEWKPYEWEKIEDTDSLQNIPALWSENETYETNDYVSYEELSPDGVKIYMCINRVKGEWDDNNWKETNIGNETAIKMMNVTEIYPTTTNGDMSGTGVYSETSNCLITEDYIEVPTDKTLVVYWTQCIGNPGLRFHIFQRNGESEKIEWIGRYARTPKDCYGVFMLPKKTVTGSNNISIPLDEDILVRISWDVTVTNKLSGLSFFLCPENWNNNASTALSAISTKLNNLNENVYQLEDETTTNINNLTSTVDDLIDTVDNNNDLVGTELTTLNTKIGNWTDETSITNVMNKEISQITEIFPQTFKGDLSLSTLEIIENSDLAITNIIHIPADKTLMVHWVNCVNDPGLRFHIFTLNPTSSTENSLDWIGRISRNPKNFLKNIFILPRTTMTGRINGNNTNNTGSIDCTGDIFVRISWDVNAKRVDSTTQETVAPHRLEGVSFFLCPKTWKDDVTAELLTLSTNFNYLNNSFLNMQKILGVTEIYPSVEKNSDVMITDYIDVPEGKTLAVSWKQYFNNPELSFHIYKFDDEDDEITTITKDATEYNNIFVYQKGGFVDSNDDTINDAGHIKIRVSWDFGKITNGKSCLLDGLSFFIFPDYDCLKGDNSQPITEHLNTIITSTNSITALNNRIQALERREKTGSISIGDLYEYEVVDGTQTSTLISKNITLQTLGIITTGVYRITLVTQVSTNSSATDSASEYIFRYYKPSDSDNIYFYKFLDIKEGTNDYAPRLTSNTDDNSNDGGVLGVKTPSANKLTANILYFLTKIA